MQPFAGLQTNRKHHPPRCGCALFPLSEKSKSNLGEVVVILGSCSIEFSLVPLAAGCGHRHRCKHYWLNGSATACCKLAGDAMRCDAALKRHAISGRHAATVSRASGMERTMAVKCKINQFKPALGFLLEGTVWSVRDSIICINCMLLSQGFTSFELTHHNDSDV